MNLEQEQGKKTAKDYIAKGIDELTRRLRMEDKNWLEMQCDKQKRTITVKFLDMSTYGMEHIIRDEVYKISEDSEPGLVECYG